jgi:hypothetical protein
MKLQVKSVRWMCLGLALVAASGLAAERDGRLARIVNEGQLGARGIAADGQLRAPGMPASLVAQRDDVCVTLGYNVKSDGSTSNLMVLKSWSSSAQGEMLEQAYADDVRSVVAEAVSDWKFRNADGDGRVQPLFTATTFYFSGSGASDAATLRGHCQINDLTAHVQAIKSSRFLPGSRDTYDLEQANRYMTQRMSLRNPGAGSAARSVAIR